MQWRLIMCFLGLWNVFLASGQEKQGIPELQLHGLQIEDLPRPLLKRLQQAPDSLALSSIGKEVCEILADQGWLEASIEQVRFSSSQKDIYFYRGPLYVTHEITFQGLGEIYREKSNLIKWEKRGPLSWELLEKDLKGCLKLYEEDGYPFAVFERELLQYQKTGDTMLVHLEYSFETGPLITIDSIIVKGNIRESPSFIYNLIRLSPNDLFQQSRIQAIPGILNNSIYYQNVPAPKVYFSNFQTARVELDLERKKSGKLDLLLGILPSNDQSLQFTGSIDVLLVSPLKQGSVLEFKFDRLIRGSQQTYVKLELPYILRTPLKASAELDLYRQEEEFLTVRGEFSAFYAFNPFLLARFYYRNRNSRLLGEALSDTFQLAPELLDGNRQIIGAGFLYDNLDYNINPAKGWKISADIGVGQKAIQRNPALPEEWYEQVRLTQNVQEFSLEAHKFWRLYNRNVLHLANRTYWLGAEEYFANDQLQVGGSRSIRGFNENQFFTDLYTFFTAEYRFQLEKTSFLFAFLDAAYLRDQVENRILYPWGTGIGMQYGTRAGLLTLTYAIGQSSDLNFQPASGVIHIGFINQF